MEKQKPNWFVRTLVIIFLLLLAVMVGFSFVKGNPPYAISAASITVLLIITVLVLSEAFQSLSIGTLLSLSRRVEEKKAENVELKGENRELRKNIVKIATSVNQSQVTANVSGIPVDWLGRMLGVTRAEEQDAEEIAIEQNVEEKVIEQQVAESSPTPPPIHQLLRFIEPEALNRYLEKYQLPLNSVTKDVQFTPFFQGVDPIMERRIVFDAYLRTPQSELFFEVRYKHLLHQIAADRIYVILSKIMHYRQAKKIQAELILILTEFPEEIESLRIGNRKYHDRFIEDFQPAIANGLLKVETITFTAEDYSRFVNLASQRERS